MDGHFYKSVKAMYTNTESCVKLNRMCTDFFDTTSGVRQGGVLSPTLFSIFINDLVEDLRGLHLGINIGESQIFALLYADIALIADSPEKLQQLIQHVKLWCDKWRLSINTEKTQIVHFRKKTTPRTDLIFIFGDVTLKVVSSYKYLGMDFYEHIDYNACVDILTSSASRALG